MRVEFLTGRCGGCRFEYASLAQAAERYQFLCWWIEFVSNHWTSGLVTEPSIAIDRTEYSLLNDFFKREVVGQAFHPEDVFAVM